MKNKPDLEIIVKEIEDEAVKRQFLICHVDEEVDLPFVTWSRQLSDFLDFATRIGVAVLYLRVLNQTENHLLHFIGEVVEHEITRVLKSFPVAGEDSVLVHRLLRQPRLGNSDKIDELKAKLRRDIEDKFKKNIKRERLVKVECTCVYNGIAHLLAFQDDSYLEDRNAIFRVVSEKVSDVEFINILENMNKPPLEEVPEIKSDKVKELANTMAQHERFIEAKSEAKRIYMAEQLFPDESVETYVQVAEQAFLVHWWHYEPLERSSKIERAVELYRKGIPLEHISGNLQIPKSQIKEAILGRRTVPKQGEMDLE